MVNKYYPPHIGGIEFHVRDLAEGLVRAGHEVKVLVSNDGRGEQTEVINGVQVKRLSRGFEAASTPVARNFSKYLQQAAPEADLVHFHFPYPWGEFAWMVKEPFTPYVVTYHSDIVRQKFALALYKPLLNRFLNRANRIMASSPQLIQNSPFLQPRQEWCRQVNFGVPVERIAHHPTALLRAAQLRASLNDRPIVLFVGRLVYYKGVDVLVQSMPDVDAEFVCIGTGPLRQLMEETAAQLGCADRLHILDPVDDDELAAWYHAADVFALPSVEPSEAFGLVQIEAHAAGTPTVSTKLPTGVVYANLDGVTGLTVEVGSPTALAAGLNAILLDDHLRATLGAQARNRALTEFTIDGMVQNVVRVYEEALTY